MKKIVIFCLIALAILIGIGFLLNPLLNTGLVLTVSPKESYVYIANETLRPNEKGEAKINLKPGKYPVSISAFGYKKEEKEITVNRYGTTKEEVKLEKIERLLENLPFNDPSGRFTIEGKYNDYMEPEYLVVKLAPIDDAIPAKWLTDNGVELEKVKVKTIIDYELSE